MVITLDRAKGLCYYRSGLWYIRPASVSTLNQATLVFGKNGENKCQTLPILDFAVTDGKLTVSIEVHKQTV